MLLAATASQPQRLLLSPPGAAGISALTDADSGTRSESGLDGGPRLCPLWLTLHPGEGVIEAVWQPPPSCFGLRKATASQALLRQQRGAWMYRSARNSVGGAPTAAFATAVEEFIPLLGVLTTHRVLLLSSTLEVLNEIRHTLANSQTASASPGGSGGSGGRGGGEADMVTSLSWAGGALLYASKGGAVSFLLPRLRWAELCASVCVSAVSSGSSRGGGGGRGSALAQMKAKMQAAGLTDAQLSWGRLCSLPRAACVRLGFVCSYFCLCTSFVCECM